MRKGINSLCGVVHDRMGHDVRLGDVFIFINRSRTTMKLLHAEDGGIVLYVKRLEEGTFRLPAYDSRSRSYPMEWRNLVMMVEGISDNPNERLKRLKASRKGWLLLKVFSCIRLRIYRKISIFTSYKEIETDDSAGYNGTDNQESAGADSRSPGD